MFVFRIFPSPKNSIFLAILNGGGEKVHKLKPTENPEFPIDKYKGPKAIRILAKCELKKALQ